MKKTICMLLITIMAGTPLNGFAARGDNDNTDEKPAWIVIADNSGTNEHAELADQTRLTLFGKFKGLTRVRKFSKSNISVINTSSGDVVWSGVPKDLRHGPKAEKLVKVIKTRNTCSNLAKAFKSAEEEAKMLARRGYNSFRVIVISPMISAETPCNNKGPIKLPQILVNFDYAGSLLKIKKLKAVLIFNIHKRQISPVNEEFSPLNEWGQKPGHLFAMFRELETAENLKTGIER